jgi:chemosensory pili system protein ChpA (sensor histidine kinase/response regulator)
VDDSLSVRKVQERFLSGLGVETVPAVDGLDALEKLRTETVDLIFTDLEMPRLNGYELISEVRGNPAWAALPVVVISSRGADKYITKAMNLGATTFLSKPFTAEQLDQILRHYANWDSAARARLETALPA